MVECVELFWGGQQFTLLYKLYTITTYIVAKYHFFIVVTENI